MAMICMECGKVIREKNLPDGSDDYDICAECSGDDEE